MLNVWNASEHCSENRKDNVLVARQKGVSNQALNLEEDIRPDRVVVIVRRLQCGGITGFWLIATGRRKVGSTIESRSYLCTSTGIDITLEA